MAQLGEILAAEREDAAAKAGATPGDIELSRWPYDAAGKFKL
jgi:hypothetical protein